MPFPTSVQTQVLALSTAITAAGDLTAAQPGVLSALAIQARQLDKAIGAAITPFAPALDAYTSDGLPQDMAAAVLAALDAATQQTALSDLRGYVGRASANLAIG